MGVTLMKWPKREKAENSRSQFSYRWKVFRSFKNLKFVWVMFKSILSEENTKNIQKIVEIDTAVTKISYFAPFGIFGNISDFFWI